MRGPLRPFASACTPLTPTYAILSTAVVFAYDYHPCARTLYEVHLSSGGGGPGKEISQPIAERLLWSYIAQIANGLKAIHTAGLAARIIEPTKIILTGKNRCVVRAVLDEKARS